MSELTMNVLEIDGKDFVLIETIDKYNFFVEETNTENICILKEEIEDGETYYVSLEDEDEIDKAFILYYDKLKK